MISILIVDDHPVVRAGLEGLIGLESDLVVVGAAADGAEAVRFCAGARPDIVLMDLRMPGGMDGAETIERIRALPDPPPILVLTTYDTDADIVRAVAAGATGYLLKDAPRDQLTSAIRSVAGGGTVLHADVAARLATRLRKPAPPQLTAREREVLARVSAGATNAEIGRALFLSEATVKTYLVRVFAKLDVTDRTAAVTKALSLGLLP
jgi:DNA-binding NarL/FixJ family response regulator